MSKNTAAARGFLGSLGVVIAALVVFFVVLYPKQASEVAPPTKTPLAPAVSKESRRQALRAPVSRDDDRADMVDSAVVRAGAKPASDGALAPSEEIEDPDIQRAIDLVDAGNVEGAQQALDGVLKRDPRSEQALIEMAMIHLLDLKQVDQAVAYLQRALDVNPENPIVMSELVSLYEEQGKIEEGLTFMQEVQSKNAGSPELAHGVGQMLILAGRDQDAIAHFEKATESPDYQVRAYRDLAEAYSKTGDLDKAIDSYGKAVHTQEQEIADKAARGLPVQFAEERLAYTKLGMARDLMRKGDFERAEGIIDEIAPILPGDEQIAQLRDSIRKRRAG